MHCMFDIVWLGHSQKSRWFTLVKNETQVNIAWKSEMNNIGLDTARLEDSRKYMEHSRSITMVRSLACLKWTAMAFTWHGPSWSTHCGPVLDILWLPLYEGWAASSFATLSWLPILAQCIKVPCAIMRHAMSWDVKSHVCQRDVCKSSYLLNDMCPSQLFFVKWTFIVRRSLYVARRALRESCL